MLKMRSQLQKLRRTETRVILRRDFQTERWSMSREWMCQYGLMMMLGMLSKTQIR